MDSRLKLLDRLKIQLQGHLYLGEEILDGWEKPAPVYLFKCPIHGLVKSTVRGRGRLDCPECLKELKSEKVKTNYQEPQTIY